MLSGVAGAARCHLRLRSGRIGSQTQVRTHACSANCRSSGRGHRTSGGLQGSTLISRLVAAISAAARNRSAAAYVAPMVLFLVLTTVESMLPHAWYPQAYCFKILAVT